MYEMYKAVHFLQCLTDGFVLRNFVRMSKTGFDVLLRKVGPKIERNARIVAKPVAKERKSKQSLPA